ncbi:HD-GYP domain-containing protein [Roseateles puraquae]|uniref:Phosphohydrolase n=1 Tax=Roseateles puraquae TaxID=431059 RepID=A0A254MZP8_9BURK|nr:HD-GYP domain-containing protein [Roseateles puraquae]MDG0854425.1 HD-GYP domain-containing protein [Roseateles puraquae]OWR00823.1 phosphohydrolase [Roseateles puraquae]
MSLFSFLGISRQADARGLGQDRWVQREQILASLLVVAWVVEARDPYTGGHLWRVSRYAGLLCERAGLPEHECARIAIGGFLHDLGKVGIPDAILRKPDRLTDEEYQVIKTHPEQGARMLAGHPLADLAREAVLHHHETPDGRGYPRGLSATAIPMAARVVGICDAFDAMTSSRPYRPGMPVSMALDKLEAALGRQFDESLGRHMMALGREGLLDHIAGHSDDGIPLRTCLRCGPTLVLRREQQAGEHVCCFNCGSDYRLEADVHDGSLNAIATEQRASAAALQPTPDLALIQRFVADTAREFLKTLDAA